MKKDGGPVQFGMVDCEHQKALCQENQIHTYPSIRLFSHKPGDRPREYPSNWWRDHKSMQQWVVEFMPTLVERVAGDFSAQVLGSLEPIVVDFFAPWCGHCVHFAPIFEQVAKVNQG
jgi:thiol-disulfide isomerase/thioredoxin